MRLNPQITFEIVGDEILALDATASSIMSITAERAQVVRQLLNGVKIGNNHDGVDELLELGIILPEASRAVSRRSLVATGAAIGASGVVALGLPVAANASSPGQLPAPSFDFLSGLVLSGSISPSGDGATQAVDFLSFPTTRLLNESDYASGFVLEWSLEPTTGFDQVFERTSTGFEWTGNVVMGSNWEDPQLTVFIRARFGTSVSESVEVVFDND
jgi:hypothetical protein